MPIDPQIALSARGVGPLVNPFDLQQQIEQAQTQRSYRATLEEQRIAEAEKRRAETERIAQGNAERTAAGEAIRQGGGVRAATLDWARQHAPNTVPSLTEYFDKADEHATKILEDRHKLQTQESELFATLADGAIAHGASVGAVKTAIDYITERFPEYQKHAEQIWTAAQQTDDAGRKVMLEQIRALAPSRKPKETAPQVVAPGSTLVGSDGKVLYSAPAAKKEPTGIAAEYEYAKTQGFTGTFEQYQNEDANRKKPAPTSVSLSGLGGLYNQTDPAAIADAIMRGEQPPKITDLGRPVGAAVASVLAKKGYSLATAMTDWNAAQKHFATLNNAQQTRIRQTADTAYHSLDLIDDLSKQWQGGRFPILNKANLALAKQGTYGKAAQQVATALDAQITDLASELANVYMGGNSPTDHALKLAEKNLRADWSDDTLRKMTQLARKNLEIRMNSIKNVNAIGASESNPYAPPAGAAPAAPAAPVAPPATGGRVRVKGPNGETGTVPKGTPLPAGWSVVGG